MSYLVSEDGLPPVPAARRIEYQAFVLIASLFGAVLGGVRAARIEPSDGLREV